jgi:hypothetical protein
MVPSTGGQCAPAVILPRPPVVVAWEAGDQLLAMALPPAFKVGSRASMSFATSGGSEA